MKNASELKYHVETADPGTKFFTRDTMKFFGDTMQNYGVREAVVKSWFNEAGELQTEPVEVAVFELYRKRPVKNGNQRSAFFRKTDFHRVHPVE